MEAINILLAELVNNAQNDPRSVYPPGSNVECEHLISIPVKVKEKTLGVFDLARQADPPFTNEEFELVELFVALATVAIHNAQLYSDITQRAAELSTLLTTSQAVSSTLHLNKALLLIVEQMVKVTGVTSCTLSRWDEEVDAIITWAQWHQPGFKGIDEQGTSYPLDDYPTTRIVLEQNRPITILASDLGADQAEVAIMHQVDALSLLMLPLTVGEQVIGLIEVVETEYERRFTSTEIHLCQALAGQAAVAIRNAQFHAETQQRLKEQTILREAGNVISSTLDLEAVLQHIVEQLGRSVDATSAYICDWEVEVKTSTVLAEYFGPEAGVEERVSDQGVTYIEKDLDFQEALQCKRPLVHQVDTPGLDADERAHLQQHGCQTALYIPLQIRGQTIAYAELWESRRRRELTAAEIDLCQGIAQQAAIGIDNARLHVETKRRAQQLTSLHELDRAITASLDISDIYHAFAEHTARIWPYDRISIELLAGDNLRLAYVAGESEA
jgi:GAF domain-containing protein